jgi:hypothetical protein
MWGEITMGRNTCAKLLWVVLAGLFALSPAHATVFSIDSFSVYRDGNLFFHDDFDDGVVPPSTGWTFPNQTEAVYSTVGNPGPENDSKLALDTSLGTAQDSRVTGNPLLVQRNRLRTNTTSDTNSGLKLNHDIAVFGVFDFIAPELNNERYSIRLTDFQTDYASNDNVDVTVRRNNEGLLSIAFRQADFDTGTMNVLDQLFLEEGDFEFFDQITLGLFTEAGSQDVYAGFSLSGGPGGNFEYLFDGIGNIFNGEVWTRAAFIATQQVTTGVPEPTTIALMLMGLFGIGLSRHKRVI